MMSETPTIETDAYTEADVDAEVGVSPKRLRRMAQKVRLIAQLAVSDRTRHVLEAMAQHYEVLATRQDSEESSNSKR